MRDEVGDVITMENWPGRMLVGVSRRRTFEEGGVGASVVAGSSRAAVELVPVQI